MSDLLLSELIERTQDAMRSFEHSQSTLYQYQMAWRKLAEYFSERRQVLFSKQLAEQYLCLSRVSLEAGVIKRWRYKLDRLAVEMLIECEATGHVEWKIHPGDRLQPLHQGAFLLLHRDYLNFLRADGKSLYTIQNYGMLSRHFLEYLEERQIENFKEVRGLEINGFIPWIAKQYQRGSMSTVLTALRSFIRFVEAENLAQAGLSQTIPSICGRVTRVFTTLTPEEEQKLLTSANCQTPLGKRNYAMLLLALRTGLRAVDITDLKLRDIDWKRNTIEIVLAKTGTPLVLPLLADVGNAIADYLLNGRPTSREPYIFLRGQAPHRKLGGHTACYSISCSMMKAAGIRQAPDDRKGFHCFRHALATQLLSADTPLPIISSILGHRNKDSTKVYLSADLPHLRACALGLSGIEVAQEELR